MATKSVHLEVTEDLTTDSFLAALTRLASRRGSPAHLFSDCGSNYIGACNELRRIIGNLTNELQKHPDLANLALQSGIQFHFNAPASSHMGGLWEATVKSAKSHLTRLLRGQVLTIEEFRTLVIRVEGMLNSRPITPLSSDPSDAAPLTPAHFFTGGPLTAIPEPGHDDDLTPHRRWHRVQGQSQAFWRRWVNKYLHTLTSRNKWTASHPSLEVGDLVLIHDPGTPPLKWKTGRVQQTFPGHDGITRVASVSTSQGILRRPAVKLFKLPI